jgi:hypothetical protein
VVSGSGMLVSFGCQYMSGIFCVRCELVFGMCVVWFGVICSVLC